MRTNALVSLIALALAAPCAAQESPKLLLGTWNLQCKQDSHSGTRTLTSALEDDGKTLRVTQDLTLKMNTGRFKGKTIACKSEFTYAIQPKLVPLTAGSQTSMDGKPGIRADLSLADGATFKWTGVLDRDGAPVDPPKEFEAKDPKGFKDFSLFRPAIPILAGELLKDTDTRKDLNVLQLPDDWFVEPSTQIMTSLAIGAQLRRVKADDGGYRIEVYASRQTMYLAEFNKMGQLISIMDDPFSGTWEVVETSPKPQKQ